MENKQGSSFYGQWVSGMLAPSVLMSGRTLISFQVIRVEKVPKVCSKTVLNDGIIAILTELVGSKVPAQNLRPTHSYWSNFLKWKR